MLVPKKDLDSFLSDHEQSLLQQFADNEPLKEAVRKVLLFGAYYGGTLKKGIKIDPTMNFALLIACQKGAKNEDIGADVKACWEAINEIEVAFKRIEMYKSIPMPDMKSNPAR